MFTHRQHVNFVVLEKINWYDVQENLSLTDGIIWVYVSSISLLWEGRFCAEESFWLQKLFCFKYWKYTKQNVLCEQVQTT